MGWTKEASREYYEKNKVKISAYARNYYNNNKEKICANKRELYKQRKDAYKTRHQERRTVLYTILGGAFCRKCGFSDERVLQFDHINSDGNLERSRKSPLQIYDYYISHPEEAKQKLQILCANCNWIKRSENREQRI